eukprot:5928991-Prorocentrum_lima.AAC.1
MRRHDAYANRHVDELRMQVQALMAEQERTGPLVEGVVGLKSDLSMTQQYFSMMSDNLASELAVLEGIVPNTKELLDMGTKMVEVDKALSELDNS